MRKLLIKYIFFSVAAAGLLLYAGGVWADAERGVPLTKGQVQGDDARISFEWKQLGNFTAYLNERDLTITFDRTVNPDFGSVLGQLYPYIVSAQRKADGKTIAFVMDKPYRIRTFKTGKTNGVILLGIDPERQRSHANKRNGKAKEEKVAATELNSEKPTAGEGEHEVAAIAAHEAKVESKDEPKSKSEQAAEAETQASEPVKEVAAAKEEPKAQNKPEPQEKPEEKVAAAKEEPKEAAPAEEPTQDEPKEAAHSSKAVVADEVHDVKNNNVASKEADKAPEPVKETAAQANAHDHAATEEMAKEVAAEKAAEEEQDELTAGALKVSVSAAEDSATLRFPFKHRAAAAVFIRSGSLWVVFNKTIALDLSDFKSLPQTVIGKAELVLENGVTAIRMPVSSTVLPTIAKEAGKYEWAVLLAPKNRLLSNALEVEVRTDPPAPPHVFIPALEMGTTIEFRDPQVGDTLSITPLYSLGEGLMHRRDFIEFTLLETAQGIVVSKKADDVKVTQLRNGLRVSPNQGITLTPGLPPVTDKDIKKSSLQSSVTLFDYDAWRVPEDRDRNKFIAELQRKIVEAENDDEASRLRMRLAQTYLSEGLAPEALAHLESIARTDIVFYRSAKISALHGVANFLMARYPEAARDFSASELNNNKEIAYWRSMTADLLGNPEPYDYLALNDDYISKYPPVFRQKLAVVAADRNVENKEYNTAIKIFDTIKQDKLLGPIEDYVNYLLAVISSATGQEEEALAMWDKLADNYKSPFVQARAEFSRILWEMERGKIDRDKAIDRLERLRLSWHGDNMELKVLGLLGNMYADKKDFANAMRIWDGAVSSFPNTTAAVAMERKLEDAFVSLFDEGTAGRMPPLEVLTLYYQYNDHVPGGNIGNQLVNLLADKLVSVDLLDEAAALLDRKMREAEKEQRSEIGARLATIHLLNSAPKKALLTLQDSVYGDIPTPLVMWRNRLLSQSLSEQQKYDKALQIIQSDLSPDAERIRMGVYWQRKDWNKVIASVEALLKARPDVSKPLTLEESDAVLKLALAYIFEDNKVQLQYLRDYFEPLMANNPYKPLFEFVTTKDVVPTPDNFNDIMESVSQTRSFLDSYRARIHTAGLSNVTNQATQEQPVAQE